MELYINNIKMDLLPDTRFNFTYKSEDVDNPSATKNSVSKTVSLPLTKNNIRAFGNPFFVRNEVIGNIDPLKKQEYRIVDKGETVETGYISVDSIDETAIYLTLYGMLGLFFYNLQTDERDGQQKGLDHIFFNWKNMDGDYYENEDTDILFYQSMDFVNQSWDELKNGGDTICSDVVPVAEYSGLYSDFKNDTVLVELTGSRAGIYQQLFGVNDMSKTYHQKIKVQTPRDLMPFEASELRANKMRLALRYSSIFNAISNPQNNGGFNFHLSQGVLNSDYYQKSFIIGKPIEFTDYNPNDVILPNPVRVGYGYSHTGTQMSSEMDLSEYTHPVLKINFPINLIFEDGIQYDQIITSGVEDIQGEYLKFVNTGYYVSIRPQYYSNGTWVTCNRKPTERIYFNPASDAWALGVFGKYDGYRYKIGTTSYTWSEYLTERYGIEDPDSIELKKMPLDTVNRHDFNFKEQWEESFQLWDNDNHPLQYERVRFLVIMKRIILSVNDTVEEDSQYFNKTWGHNNDGGYTLQNTTGWIGTNIMSISNESSGNRDYAVRKKDLFSGWNTPYWYLIAFARALGLKFIQNDRDITMITKEEYYNQTLNITEYEGKKIKPWLSDYRYLKYQLENDDDLYANWLYNRKSDTPYACKIFDTLRDVNDEMNEVEDGTLKQAMLYNQLSQCNKTVSYFPYPSVEVWMPSFAWFGYVTKTEYDNGDTSKSTDTQYNIGDKIYQMFGCNLTTINRVEQDVVDKICNFSNDSNPIDMGDQVVFFNGFKSLGEHKWRLTAPISEMYDLEDGETYLWFEEQHARTATYPFPFLDSESRIIGYTIAEIPQFSDTLTDTDDVVVAQWGYNEPSYKFNTKRIWTDNSLWKLYWKDWMESLYANKQDEIECRIRKPRGKKPEDILRSYVNMDGVKWVVKEITDWTLDDEMIKIKMIKTNG